MLRVLRQGVRPRQSVLRPPERGARCGHQHPSPPLRAAAGDLPRTPCQVEGLVEAVSAGGRGPGRKELQIPDQGQIHIPEGEFGKIALRLRFEVNC